MKDGARYDCTDGTAKVSSNLALTCTQHAKQIRATKHPRTRDRVWFSRPRISTRLHEHTHDFILAFEDGACDRRLPKIVWPVRVCSALNEAARKFGMACIRREHQKRVACRFSFRKKDAR
jgi:hypothetical protein